MHVTELQTISFTPVSVRKVNLREYIHTCQRASWAFCTRPKRRRQNKASPICMWSNTTSTIHSLTVPNNAVPLHPDWEQYLEVKCVARCACVHESRCKRCDLFTHHNPTRWTPELTSIMMPASAVICMLTCIVSADIAELICSKCHDWAGAAFMCAFQ
jgi:hypothetical protein